MVRFPLSEGPRGRQSNRPARGRSTGRTTDEEAAVARLERVRGHLAAEASALADDGLAREAKLAARPAETLAARGAPAAAAR